MCTIATLLTMGYELFSIISHHFRHLLTQEYKKTAAALV